jgi:CRISPR/Cas system CMR subunit Cmr6 (Cas7 group RAMP superfamily)
MKSLEQQQNEQQQNKVETALKLNAQIEDLVSRLKEQQSANAILNTKIDHLTAHKFVLDESSTQKIIELKNALNSVSIPSEIKLTKTVQFSDMTKTVLIWFFCLSVPVVVGSFLYATHVRSEASKIIEPNEVREAQEQWLYDYAAEMKKRNPKSHSAYLDAHPFPKE